MTGAAIRLSGPDDVAGFWRGMSQRACGPAALDAPSFVIGDALPDLLAVDPHVSPDLVRGPALTSGSAPSAPAARALISKALLHKSPERFALAARVVARLSSEPHLLAIASDPDITRLRDMEKSVRRDMHKMTAFVRFRETEDEHGAKFVAWFEPEHHIVAATAPFFQRRFANMRWSILTPQRCAHWDGNRLTLSGGSPRSAAPEGDPLEDVWRTYYGSIFNPARLKVRAMQAQMPKKYWKNLPESQIIAPLIHAAQARSARMIAAGPTTPKRRPSANDRNGGRIDAQRSACSMSYSEPAPIKGTSIASLVHGLQDCRRCNLHCHATQAVPGEGPTTARLMIVGEQPGDQEDRSGRPFVGPAGKLLDIALARSGIDRGAVYLTNAVKHFKFEPRGKHRLHKSPSAAEIDHCRWWLDQEIALVRPRLILSLGASAGRAILGRPVTIREDRSALISLGNGTHALLTVHPAYLLRLTSTADKRREWDAFRRDLENAREFLERADRAARA